MIEIEKKFIIDEQKIANLLKSAEFVGQTRFTDIYWDKSDYALTSSNLWLRCREGRFELKVPMLGRAKRNLDQYEELETEEAIARKLNLNIENGLEKALLAAQYAPFAEIITIRNKYKKDGFTIDINEMDFGYKIMEIELLVKDKSEMDDAVQKILSFARSYDLQIAQVRGKILEYLRRYNPHHYNALIRNKVIND